jgi:alpha-glucosidase
MLKLRQRLLPYLYTLFEECHRTGAPILRPLFWAYPDDQVTYSMDDEFMCGDTLLVAPITRPGVEYRHAYLPAGSWFHLWTGARVDGPAHVLVHAPLGQPAVYVRANTALPLWPEMNHAGQEAADPLTFVLYPSEGRGTASFYEDAGEGHEHLKGVYGRRVVSCEVEAGNIRVVLGEQEGTFVSARRHVRLELREIASAPQAVRLGNGSAAWRYDPAQRRVIVDLNETAGPQVIDLSMG